jgi:hypothetical protein
MATDAEVRSNLPAPSVLWLSKPGEIDLRASAGYNTG